MAFFDIHEWGGNLYSGGWRSGAGGSRPVVEPATGKDIGSYGLATADDVQHAAKAARQARDAWAAAPYEERAAVLRRAARQVEGHAETFCYWLEREAGSSKRKAEFETKLTAARLHAAAGLASLPYGKLLRSATPRLSMVQRIPIGTLGVIAPFNFPTLLAMRAVAPALALGNAVILKPDRRTAVSGGLILGAILRDAGLPEGIFHALPGAADVGEALVDAPSVRVISFTGSTRGGRAVALRAAQHLKRVHLELGGNNAMLVLPDADIRKATSAGAWGSFVHQGQICMTIGRLLVHDKIYDEYVERMTASAEKLRVGDGATTDAELGPLIDARQRDRVHAIVTETVAAGAKLTTGGTYEDLFYRPTVLADMRPEYRAFQEEIFGPVAPIMKFSSPDEAVDIVNQSDYGLSLSILSGNPITAFKLARRMHSGSVHINDQTVGSGATSPTGGTGLSGNGARYGGPDANMEGLTEMQWVTIDGEIPDYPF